MWGSDYSERANRLASTGLYDPADEHDACGIGLVAAIDGVPRRDIVVKAIEGLRNVWHRGAVDADGKTGDGAGIHLQLPIAFFRDYITSIGKPVNDAPLAVGMVFLPKKNFAAQETCRAIVEAEILRLGYRIHGWRQVPVQSDVIGDIANESRPEIEQIIIAGKVENTSPACGGSHLFFQMRGGASDAVGHPLESAEEANSVPRERGTDSCENFERDLYLIRRRIEQAVRAQAISDFYICSLSSRSIIYKGLFKAEQLTEFYPDLNDARFISSFAIFHQRFSTNTAPAWQLAQPFRVLAHNGEINTLKGNKNFMRSHEATFSSPHFEGFEADVVPVIPDNTSDTGALDAVMEILMRAGRPIPLAKLILMPPAWSMLKGLPQAHRDLLGCINSISEPWDGPAAIVATDTEWVIAGMDRNGLRPLRTCTTRDGLLICASESGMVPVAEEDVLSRGRLGPGEMIGVNLKHGVLYDDPGLKDHLAAQHPYREWLQKLVRLSDIVESAGSAAPDRTSMKQSPIDLRSQQIAAGYTHESVEEILVPMATTAKEAIGSMGDDTPLAILSDRHRPFHHFFRQNFSQVTNPPIDSLRERRVMSLKTRFGNDGNYLALDDTHGEMLLADTPVILSAEMAAIAQHFSARITRIPTGFAVSEKGNALRRALERIVRDAESAVRSGRSFLLLSDEGVVDAQTAAIPMILAVSAVQSHLVRCKLRKKAALIVQSAECADVHALAVLIGAGATVVHPWLAEATLRACAESADKALPNFREAMSQGLLKIMSKMGISVVSAYRGGLNFEAIGLSRALVTEFFPGLPSRISGIGLEGIEGRVRSQHAQAFAVCSLPHRGRVRVGAELASPIPTGTASNAPLPSSPLRGEEEKLLPIGGFYRARAGTETHGWPGESVHLLQTAIARGSYQMYKKFSEGIRTLAPVQVRDLLDFKTGITPVPLEEVEPITEIRRRFIAPAMSLGALSPEAHEVLAIAMNRMGASSNSGEGGEGPERYRPQPSGDNANSVVKQVASGRFGVTAEYLNSAREIQIKVAQGAKPGEGGQLPGFKVTVEIARLRHATPGVSLISPPPHHDIYSIEDLAQLIYDLKQINPRALISVKLVAQAGIGTIASGVAKAMADKIVISGHSGGTGASAWSSIKHAGSPWEMGLSEAHQVLTLNRLRHRVTLQTDGGLKTGRDIVIAAILGAEEFALGTASLVAMGCILVRQCHSNTCPVGITTQDPALRAKFEGTVEKVITLVSFVAEEVREILAQLGARKLDDVVGRTELLHQVNRGSEEMVDLDLNTLLAQADPGRMPRHSVRGFRNEVPETLDTQMIADAGSALERAEKIQLAYNVRSTMRTIGARLSSLVVEKFPSGAPHEEMITVRLRGTAGQSLGAFLSKGIRIELLGDANDYVGKGLSGGTLVIRPRPSSTLAPQDHTIIGNTVLYGATSGFLFASGQAGERFAVRNSGATVVVEGCGSNGCEYMTGGVAVLLGSVGYNFAAGMTGGMAYVYDASAQLLDRVNDETVVVQRLMSVYWEEELRRLVARHAQETGSLRAQTILAQWDIERQKFWQVCPKEMLTRLPHPLEEPANSGSQTSKSPFNHNLIPPGL